MKSIEQVQKEHEIASKQSRVSNSIAIHRSEESNACDIESMMDPKAFYPPNEGMANYSGGAYADQEDFLINTTSACFQKSVPLLKSQVHHPDPSIYEGLEEVK